MDIENIPLNPIDIVEDVIYQKKWSFSRSDDYELVGVIQLDASNQLKLSLWRQPTPELPYQRPGLSNLE